MNFAAKQFSDALSVAHVECITDLALRLEATIVGQAEPYLKLSALFSKV